MNRQFLLYIIIAVLLIGFGAWQIAPALQPKPQTYEIIYEVWVGIIGTTSCNLVSDSFVDFTFLDLDNITQTIRFGAPYNICTAMRIHEGQTASILVERGRNIIVSWQLVQ